MSATRKASPSVQATPEVPGKNRYCGPFALAVAAKLSSTDEAAEILRGITGQRAIRGVPAWALGHALGRLLPGRVVCEKTIPKDFRPTLAAWLRKRQGSERADTFIVWLTDHFVVVRGRKFIDNHTRQWVWLSDAPHRRRRVKGYWQIKSEAKS